MIFHEKGKVWPCFCLLEFGFWPNPVQFCDFLEPCPPCVYRGLVITRPGFSWGCSEMGWVPGTGRGSQHFGKGCIPALLHVASFFWYQWCEDYLYPKSLLSFGRFFFMKETWKGISESKGVTVLWHYHTVSPSNCQEATNNSTLLWPLHFPFLIQCLVYKTPII